MFVSFWIIFLVTGLIMAVFTVSWGVKNKQFDDQDRARFLPLVGISAKELAAPPSKKHRAETIGIYTMLVVGITALGAGFYTALMHL